MSWSAFQRGHPLLAAGIVFFVICAIAVTLFPIGRLEVSWDEVGITVKKRPKPATFIRWSDIQKLTADHLGYHVRAPKTGFRISRHNMPKELLQKIRSSIRKNSKATNP